MEVVDESPELRSELAELQAESLKPIAMLVGALGYFWLLWSVRPGRDELPSLAAWLGIILLTLVPVLSYVLKTHRPAVAAHLLVWAMLGAAGCAMLTFPAPATLYLFILPIIFAAVLLSRSGFLLVATLALFSIPLINAAHTGMSFLPQALSSPFKIISLMAHSLLGDVALPLVVTGLVTLASWLSVHNLYTALAWFWHAYERARRNERIARDRQAELRRALKALDEATHRLGRTNYMLTLARDQAEEARRLKQQFAQTISHELRTPLNLIVGFAELMAQSPEYYGGRLSPAYLRDLNIIHRNACHLQALVNDVLDLARIEAAQMSLLPEETHPATLVQEAVHTARSLVEAQGLALHTEVQPALPSLWVDPIRIRQVLFNLLNNAARFTDQGSVTVRVRQQGEEMIFAVADTGVGIASQDLCRIFDEFHQADGSTRRCHGGAGLGLAISRRFVELHGGRIWVESQVDQGSTFTFSLPINRTGLGVTPDSCPAELPGATVVRSGEKPVLLAVTRSPSAAALLTRYVRGFETVIVPDLEQARFTARQLMPQAVVIDATCEDIAPVDPQGLARTWGMPGVPFITCPLPGEEPLSRRLAVDGYLIKPVSRQRLWDVLRRLGEHVDKVLVVDDDQDFVLLLSRLLEDSPLRRYQVIGAYTGQEGLAMLRHHRPDLVLLDLMLPDMDGIQVIEQIRSDSRWQHIPIVIVSAQDEMDHQVVLQGAMRVAKADGLVAGEIVQWIQKVVDVTTRLKSPPLTSPPEPPVPSAASPPKSASPERR